MTDNNNFLWASEIKIDKEKYRSTKPFPYMFQDNFLDEKFALDIQSEILEIPRESWDRYDNPFETKFTLRDKYNFPPQLQKLFGHLTSCEFIQELSDIVGYQLINDSTRNFWGVHTYMPGDKLDIHMDAGFHPTLNLKKQVTLGIYLSKNWKEGCELEIWKGDANKIFEKVDSIAPIFNRLVIFTCDDYSWHGNPEPSLSTDSNRIFITLSYLSDNMNVQNKRVKAFFVARPQDEPDENKDRLRILRSDPEKYKEIYKLKIS